MPPHAAQLRRHLEQLGRLRGHGHSAPQRLQELKDWQSLRLQRTYADIASQPRYRAATAFFLEDLYGPRDFSARDQAMLHIVPVMSRILPAFALETAALAIELEALSEELDQRTALALPEGAIDGIAYGIAYRAGSAREQRERQIDLIVAVGERLDALVRKPLVHRTLKLMRRPAHLAGLGELQDFLENGFESFRAMHGAHDFLALLRARETAILNDLFSGGALAL